MAIDTKSTPAAVLAFGGWTLVHTIIMLVHRTILINTGKAKPSGFVPSRHEPQTTFYGRVCASHANCVENIAIFSSIVLSLTISSGGAMIANPDELAGLAWRTVYFRLGQSLMHWLSDTSDAAITCRFLFFLGQLYCLSAMLYRGFFI